MKNEILAPSVIKAHNYAAEQLAESYLKALKADTDASLRYIDGIALTFRSELADAVYTSAAQQGISRIKVRHSEIVLRAKRTVQQALWADAGLYAKLSDIRAKQDDRCKASALAEAIRQSDLAVSSGLVAALFANA